MVNNIFIKILLMPFTLLYGIGVSFKNSLYSTGLLKSSSFSIPVISVGNLSIGGAGKTPHIEYLIELLSPYIYVATLSRGYKRDTKGFRLVSPKDNARTAGDEPILYARKYPEVKVFVAENRALAIPDIVRQLPHVQCILLDDAYQHRVVQPNLNILLTQYEQPFYRDFLLPVGRLREFRSAYQRADIIIVSKCPDDLGFDDKERVTSEIIPQAHQKLFFTKYKYLTPYSFYFTDQRLMLDKDLHIILISGIANTSYLTNFLRKSCKSVTHLEYEDHHYFTDQDIDIIKSTYLRKRDDDTTIVVTTEKDAMRLDMHKMKLYSNQIPIFILPIKVEFLFDQQEEFNQLVKNTLLAFKV